MANRTGRELKIFVASDRLHASSILEKPIYTTQYFIGNSIYEKPRYVDLILYHPANTQRN